MRKLIHKVGWLTQSHVHQSTAQEYMPFQFQRLCFFCYSALNPSVGVRKKLAPSFTQMNVLLASAGCSQCFLVFFFFLLSLPILVILSIKLSQLPLRTEIFLFLPQSSRWPRESFTLLAGLWPSTSNWPQHCQIPANQRHRDYMMTFWGEGDQGATLESQRGLSIQRTNLFSTECAKV